MLTVSIDYDFWAKMDRWDLHQAVALFVGWDPNLSYYQRSPGYDDYKKLMMLVNSAREVGILKNKNTPTEFYIWAQNKNIKIAPKLATAITTYNESIIDWKSKYQEKLKESNRKDEKIHYLESELENSFTLLEKDDPFYSSELNTAIVLQGMIKKEFTVNLPTTSEMAEIVNRQFASENLSSTARDRIVTVVNPDTNKDGGRNPPKLPIKNMSGSQTV